ncbi:MAG: T9SS type A sorting domain-containing protein, partial [Bacteroidota bacterium]
NDVGSGGEDWDSDSEVYIEVDVGQTGTFTKVLAFAESNAAGDNFAPSQDTDFNGVGDGTLLTSALTKFSASISGSASLMDIRLVIEYLDEPDEDIAIDNIELVGTLSPMVGFDMNSSSLMEGNTGSTAFGVDVTLTDYQSSNVEVTISDQGTGTATGGGVDFTIMNQVLTFTGNGTQQVLLEVTGDGSFESDETIVLELIISSGTGIITIATHTITIINDDNLPCLEVIGFQSDISMSQLLLRATDDITAGTVIYLTDNEWDEIDQDFNTGEQVSSWTAPGGGLASGETILINDNQVSCGTFIGDALNLATNGDQIYITYSNPLFPNTITSDDICFGVKISDSSNADLPAGKGIDLSSADNAFLSGTDVTNPSDWTTSNDPVTMPMPSCNVAALPIELVSLNAYVQGENVRLEWQTATELNNDFMAVERSYDGTNFIELGQIQGAGTTFTPQLYSFTDEAPFNGFNYYRLKQVDFDGTFEYSEIVVVDVVLSKFSISLYPTVTSNMIQVAFRGSKLPTGRLDIYDMTGKLVNSLFINQQAIAEIDVTTYVGGQYVARFVSGNNVKTLRFIKL